MKIKKYIAGDMREALARIKKDMGPDAVILQSKKVRQKGFKGFFAPRKIEVTAAVDHRVEPKARPEKGISDKRAPAAPRGENYGKLESEIQELKHLVKQVISQHYVQGAVQEESPLNQAYQAMVNNEVDYALAQGLVEEILAESQGKELSEKVVDTLMREKIGSRLKVFDPGEGKKVFCFVGPTGVGKTTTLAKLAAHYAVFKERKVGLVTIDTYRIGAVEQLKNYAHFMDVPIEVAMSPADLAQSLDNMKDYDYVMIDTAGRNSNNYFQVCEIMGFTRAMPGAEIFLVLSVTTKSRDMLAVADNLKSLNYNSIIFTKLDETSTYGSIFNVCCHTSLPVAFLSTGQKVPEDIEFSSRERLVDLIMGVEAR